MIPFDASGAFHPRAGSHELRRLAVRGAAATVSASGLGLAVQVVGTVILARLLTPTDFGVVTMVTTFSLLLVSFGSNGFTEAVIQFEEIDHQTASNLLWLNTGAGLVLAIMFAAAGTLLARFYGNPLVANVTKGLSAGIFIASASIIHIALLKRAMRFATTSVNEVVGRIVYTIVPILLAFRGWGYWALVAGIVAQQLSMTIGAWWLCRWIPSFPRRTGKTGGMVRFAWKVFGQFGVEYSQRNVDNLLVGWRFNAVALGFYKKAFDLFALTASQITAPLNNVALATLSRLNQDHVRFRRYLASSLGMVAFLGMAASADLALVGRDVVRLVLGPKWLESGGINANRLTISRGAALGPFGSCRGVEYFLLDALDSRLLVCRATHRVWRPCFDWRYLEIHRRSFIGGRNDRHNHPRHPALGYSFKH
jgi:O-antigen/teichoic acid export membrane protein